MVNYHLTKEKDEWKLTREGAERAALTSNTKEDALQQSIDYMERHGGSLKIHKEDGQFQEERTYPRSADPRSSKG